MLDMINRNRNATLATINEIKRDVIAIRETGREAPHLMIGFHNGLVTVARHLLGVAHLEMIEPRTTVGGSMPSPAESDEDQEAFFEHLDQIVQAARRVEDDRSRTERPGSSLTGSALELHNAIAGLDAFLSAKLRKAGEAESPSASDAGVEGQASSSPAPAPIPAVPV